MGTASSSWGDLGKAATRRAMPSMTIDITPEMRDRAVELLTRELEAIAQRMRVRRRGRG